MDAFLDVDFILKVGCLGCLDVLRGFHGISTYYTLPSTEHIIRKKIKCNIDRGEEIPDWIRRNCLDISCHISPNGSLEELEGINEIDVGEILLFSALVSSMDSICCTGDKRAIGKLSELAMNNRRLSVCRGRIVCFEQMVLYLIKTGKFAQIDRAVKEKRVSDKYLGCSFGYSESRMQSVVQDCIEKDVEKLREDFGGMLCAEDWLVCP